MLLPQQTLNRRKVRNHRLSCRYHRGFSVPATPSVVGTPYALVEIMIWNEWMNKWMKKWFGKIYQNLWNVTMQKVRWVIEKWEERNLLCLVHLCFSMKYVNKIKYIPCIYSMYTISFLYTCACLVIHFVHMPLKNVKSLLEMLD